MASSGRGGRQVWQDQTGRFYYYDPRTNEIVYSDGTRVPYTAQPTANIPRTNAGAARQLPANNFSTQPYNQQYTTSPPTRAGQTQGIQNVSRQLRNVSIAASPVPIASGPSHAAGQPIDGADVVRNPLIWGAPPRRFSFRPEIQRGLLDPEFKVRDRPGRYFLPGKVFLTLWTEPHSATSAATSNNDVFAVRYGERAFCRVRRFIVVRAGEQSCTALAVSTHGGRGSPKINQSVHGVIYTGKSVPDTRNEPGMQPKAIKVNPDVKGAELDTSSRLNYAKVYNIEHNVKVKNFGSLNPESLRDLIEQFNAVFTSKLPTFAAPQDRETKPDRTGQGSKTGGRQQYLGIAHQNSVTQHTRNLQAATRGGQGTVANTQANSAGARGQQQSLETVESEDDEEDDEEDDDGDGDEEDDAENDDDDGAEEESDAEDADETADADDDADEDDDEEDADDDDDDDDEEDDDENGNAQ